MKKFVYADNAATTKVSEKVLSSMLPYYTEGFGNASSIYALGRSAQASIEKARAQVASGIGCESREVYFTSGGSESDNWAVKSVAKNLAKQGKNHIITTVFEHHAILHTCQALEKEGFDVTYIPIDDKGYVNPSDIENAITDKTALVTVMYANNEIGTIQPIAQIGKICREKKVLFHTDAVQAIGNVPINVKEDCIDMLSISGHKIHAPKGVGALYVRKGIVLGNLIHGGGQEKGKRAGTENVPSIVGLGVAVTEACNIDNINAKIQKLTPMRDRIIEQLLKLPRTRLNGGTENRLCGNVNISFEGVEGESLLLYLDNMGICASSGSACTSGDLDPSHVLLALGLKHEVAHGSLRISLSDDACDEDVDYIIECVPKAITALRAMSPLWERITKGE